MLPKYDEIFDTKYIFAILDILLLDFHQNINLIESQLHVLTACSHNFHSYVLLGLVVKGSNHLTESPPPQPFQQLIAVADLLVFAPDVPSLQIIFSCTRVDAYVVYCLLIHKLHHLIFG